MTAAAWCLRFSGVEIKPSLATLATDLPRLASTIKSYKRTSNLVMYGGKMKAIVLYIHPL